MANAKHEDVIMKMGVDYFRDTILKSLGIDYEFVDVGSTELVELTIHSMYMDFTLLTKEGFYIHIEFQTTDKGESDLRRFLAYDAVYSHKTGKNVITYVIYSGGIQSVKAELNMGLFTYRIQPVYLKAKNAEEVFDRMKEKIRTAIILAKGGADLTAEKTTAMLYTLADKFLDNADLDEIKEVVVMTRIGQMLLDEGIERGIERGMERGMEQGMQLTQYLLDNNRTEDLKRAVKDEAYRKKLLEELNLQG